MHPLYYATCATVLAFMLLGFYVWVTGKGRQQAAPESTLVSAGGWCAPASVLYDTESVLDTFEIEPEPDELPRPLQSSRSVEYVIRPCEDFYGKEEVYSTLEQAEAAFAKRVAQHDPTEGAWIVKRHSQEIVLRAEHGTYVPDVIEDWAADIKGANYPSVVRGGIEFTYGEDDKGIWVKPKEAE